MALLLSYDGRLSLFGRTPELPPDTRTTDLLNSRNVQADAVTPGKRQPQRAGQTGHRGYGPADHLIHVGWSCEQA